MDGFMRLPEGGGGERRDKRGGGGNEKTGGLVAIGGQGR